MSAFIIVALVLFALAAIAALWPNPPDIRWAVALVAAGLFFATLGGVHV